MTDDELNDLITLVVGNWTRISPGQYRAMGFAWKKFCGGFGYDETLAAVERLAARSTWAPRATEVRTEVLRGRDPDPLPHWADGWSELRGHTASLARGTQTSRLTEATEAVVRRLGGDICQGLATNADREMFKQIYLEEAARIEATRYASS